MKRPAAADAPAAGGGAPAVGGSAAAARAAPALRALLELDVIESAHTLGVDAPASEDADRDCCAFCASDDVALSCDACNRAVYCCAAHQAADADAHGEVCAVLTHVAGLEPAMEAVSPAEEAALVLRLLVRRQQDGDVDDWPSLFREPLLAPAAGGAAAASPAGSPRKRSKREDGGARAGGAGGAGAGFLAEQARLAVVSATLTYPLTAGYALRAFPALGAAVRAAQTARRPLRVLVLGAASPELAHGLAGWRLLARALPGVGLALTLVGPEVPAHLHLTTSVLPPLNRRARGAAAAARGAEGADAADARGAEGAADAAADGDGDGFAAAFFSGTFAELVHLQMAGPSTLPPALRPAPDVALAFNPGFSCEDYDWGDDLSALSSVAARAAAAGPGAARLPLLVAQSTLLEAAIEAELLCAAGFALAGPEVTRNPLPSLEVLQSGTCANDVYRKSAYIAAYYPHAPSCPGGGGGGGRRRRGLLARLWGVLAG